MDNLLTVTIVGGLMVLVGLVGLLGSMPEPEQEESDDDPAREAALEHDRKIEAARKLAEKGADYADIYTRPSPEPEPEIMGQWPGLPPMGFSSSGGDPDEATKARARQWLKEQR